MSAPKNVTEIKASALATFIRSDSAVETELDNFFDVWVSMLCRHFPWWVTTIYPGDLSASFPLTLSSVTKLAGDWIHRGWFVTTAGQETYVLRAPYDDSIIDTVDDWHIAEATKVHYVKKFTSKGAYEFDLFMGTPHEAAQRTNYGDASSEPWHYWLDTIPGENGLVSAIRMHPVPSEVKLYQCSFSLAHCPTYQDDSMEYWNRFVTYCPEVVKLYLLMKLSRHFGEVELFNFYREELFGNPPRGHNAGVDQIHGGLLGDMKTLSITRNRNKTKKFAFTTKGRNHSRRGRWSVGRGRYWGGSPLP